MDTKTRISLAEATKIENDEARGTFWLYVIVVYVVLLLVAAILSFFPVVIEDENWKWVGETWNWGLEMFLLLAVYTIASWKEIGPSDIGVRLLFGDPVDQAEPGLTFVPIGIITLTPFANETQQAELPAEPGLIYRETASDPDGKSIPKGKYPPIRIVFGKPDDPKTIDPYDQRMVAEVTPVIRYRIVNAVAFLRTIKTWENARLQIEDAVVAVLNEELSKVTPAKALTQLSGPEGIYKKLERAIDDLLWSWGIDLVSISLKPFGYSHKLNEAVLEVPKAQREKEAQIIRAEGTKEATALVGQGKGAARKAEIDGETEGLENQVQKLKIDGSAVLAAQTARDITSNPGQTTIIAGSGGFSDLATVGTVLGRTLNQQKGATS